MARRSSGKNTTPISTALDSDLHRRLVELAAQGEISPGRYCRAVIEDAIRRGVIVRSSVSYEITEKNK